jgi:hypothetical protein
VFGAGAIGFFALPYTIIVYPLVFLILPRMWSVAHKQNFITAGDFVQGRYGNKWLALAVAITGIIATMPYIALQLLGLQVVIGAMGVGTVGLYGDLPLIIAFVILAAFTYTSGLRAPAMIAVVTEMGCRRYVRFTPAPQQRPNNGHRGMSQTCQQHSPQKPDVRATSVFQVIATKSQGRRHFT